MSYFFFKLQFPTFNSFLLCKVSPAPSRARLLTAGWNYRGTFAAHSTSISTGYTIGFFCRIENQQEVGPARQGKRSRAIVVVREFCSSLPTSFLALQSEIPIWSYLLGHWPSILFLFSIVTYKILNFWTILVHWLTYRSAQDVLVTGIRCTLHHAQLVCFNVTDGNSDVQLVDLLHPVWGESRSFRINKGCVICRTNVTSP